MKVYPRTQHGFCFPERAVYAAAQSEEVWTTLFDLWDRNLKPKERVGTKSDTLLSGV